VVMRAKFVALGARIRAAPFKKSQKLDLRP
jgi:hypothetical protein